MKNFIANLFNHNKKTLNKYQKDLLKINSIGKDLPSLSDNEFKDRINNYITSKDNLTHHESYALIREASKRILGLYHYDVQIIGGLALLDNKIAEMKTGEGKTLVTALAAIHNALIGRKVHVVTVNNYLSERDYNYLKPLYDFFQIKNAFNTPVAQEINYSQKKSIHNAQIIHTTHNELCFDYLRSNDVKFIEDQYLPNEYFDYVIIDEVDSVLIDDARNPLILSSPSDIPLDNYQWAKLLVNNHLTISQVDEIYYSNAIEEIQELSNISQEQKEYQEKHQVNGDFYIEPSTHTINIFNSGYEKIEQFLINNHIIKTNSELYNNGMYLSLIHNAILAKYVYQKDVHYIVRNGVAIIVDQSTGRLLEMSRWREGVHQAIEAKENINIMPENKPRSQITYQTFFNFYKDKAGMTGTAITEAHELMHIYGLDTICIPTNKPVIRKDNPDYVFLDKETKNTKLIETILEKHNKGQPLLIGCPNIKISEEVAQLLDKENLQYKILNAKNHQYEAEIIAYAGQKNAITISTNMAGRGTDILLGYGVVELGGLCVIGVDKNYSRRIDNQLRGRAGRQGEVGESMFFVSLDDELITRFTNESMINYAKNFLKDFDDIAKSKLNNSWNKMVEQAQKKAESLNYASRQNNLKIDNIISEQRNTFYKIRNDILSDNHDAIDLIIKDYLSNYFSKTLNLDAIDDNLAYTKAKELLYELNQYTESKYLDDASKLIDLLPEDNLIENMVDIIWNIWLIRWSDLERIEGMDARHSFSKLTIISALDNLWSNHLEQNEILKHNVRLSVYAQKNPLHEFQKRSHAHFMEIFNQLPAYVIQELIKEDLSPDISDIENFSFSDEIHNMTPDEIKAELDQLTKKLLQTELIKIKDELKNIKN